MNAAACAFLSLLLACPPPEILARARASLPPPPQKESNPSPSQEPAPPRPRRAAPEFAFGLEEATPVKLKTKRQLSSAVDRTGDQVDFEVTEDVVIQGRIVIPKGGIAWGKITNAKPKRRLGRAGKLDVTIEQVRLTDGERVPLRAVRDVQGKGRQGLMTGAMVATGILFFPVAPLWLFMHGKDIEIPSGSEVTAYVNGDTALDESKFTTSATGQSPPPADPTPPAPPPSPPAPPPDSSPPPGPSSGGR